MSWREPTKTAGSCSTASAKPSAKGSAMRRPGRSMASCCAAWSRTSRSAAVGEGERGRAGVSGWRLWCELFALKWPSLMTGKGHWVASVHHKMSASRKWKEMFSLVCLCVSVCVKGPFPGSNSFRSNGKRVPLSWPNTRPSMVMVKHRLYMAWTPVIWLLMMYSHRGPDGIRHSKVALCVSVEH